MVEAGADEVSEELLVEALAFGHEAIQPIIALQEEMRAQLGKEKREIVIAESDLELEAAVKARLGNRIPELIAANTDRHDRNDAMDELREEVVDSFLAEDELADPKAIRGVISKELKKADSRANSL